MNKALKQASPKKSAIVPAMMAGVLVILAAIGFKAFQSSPPAPVPATPPAQDAPRAARAPRSAQPPGEASDPTEVTPAPAPAPTPRLAASPAPSPPPEFVRVDARDLVASIAGLTGKEPVTPDQAQKWKDSLQQLIRQGPSSIPAIQQLLSSNMDANFAGVSGAGALGYGSLRSAMLDALTQIGGPESTDAMLQVLRTSLFPTDVTTLATALNAPGPGQYQTAILDAVRQQLNLGAMDQLSGANVLPLFQVLSAEAANGANITGDLAQYAGQWPFYTAIALAALPDGAGVPTLTQIAQGAVPGNQAAAAQALAELAPQNAQALNTLLDLAKNDQLSDSILSQLAPFLGGRQYVLGPPQAAGVGGFLTFHMAAGNQDFSAYDGAGTMTQPQISQNLSVINQLLQAVPSTDYATVEALQQQRNMLVGRQPH